jgi:hypothetical protein
MAVAAFVLVRRAVVLVRLRVPAVVMPERHAHAGRHSADRLRRNTDRQDEDDEETSRSGHQGRL